MPPKVNRTEIIAIRVIPETRKAIDKAAYDSHRTLSNWVECACLWAIENKAIPTIPRPK